MYRESDGDGKARYTVVLEDGRELEIRRVHNKTYYELIAEFNLDLTSN